MKKNIYDIADDSSEVISAMSNENIADFLNISIEELLKNPEQYKNQASILMTDYEYASMEEYAKGGLLKKYKNIKEIDDHICSLKSGIDSELTPSNVRNAMNEQLKHYESLKKDLLKKLVSRKDKGSVEAVISEEKTIKTFSHGGEITKERIDEILKHYIMAALWSSTDESHEPLDSKYSIDDISEETKKKMREDVEKFVNENIEAINKSELLDEQIGHDLWLTRNRHGAGFFDHNLDSEIEEKLTKGAQSLGETNLEVGDDNKIYSLENGGKIYNKGGYMAEAGEIKDIDKKTTARNWWDHTLSINEQNKFIEKYAPIYLPDYMRSVIYNKNNNVILEIWKKEGTPIYSEWLEKEYGFGDLTDEKLGSKIYYKNHPEYKGFKDINDDKEQGGEYKEGGKLKKNKIKIKPESWRDIPYHEVEAYADEKGLSIAREGDYDEMAQELFEKKYANKKALGGDIDDQYEHYLNDLYDEMYDIESAVDKFIYLTSPKRGKHLTEMEIKKYAQNKSLGTLLREYDETAFYVGRSEWESEQENNDEEYAKGGKVKPIPDGAPFGVYESGGEYYIIDRKDDKAIPSNSVKYWTGNLNSFPTKKDAIKAVWTMLDKMHEEMPAYNPKYNEGGNVKKSVKQIVYKKGGISKKKASDYPVKRKASAKGGRVETFLNKASEQAKRGFEKAKEGTKKAYKSVKEYTKDKIKAQKKKVALEVLDDTKDKVDAKYKIVLKGAENIIEDKYQKGGTAKKTFTECPIGTVVQSIVFDRKDFNVISAKKWLKENDFKYGKSDIKKSTIRFRQEDPSNFKKASFRNKPITKSIMLVIGCPKQAKL